MADPKVINYAGEQKIYNKEKVDELLATITLKSDKIIKNTRLDNLENVAANKEITSLEIQQMWED